MSWQLKVSEPSGEIRTFPLNGPATLGRRTGSNILLRDPSSPADAATIWPLDPAVFWIKIHESCPAGRVGDIAIREAQLPVGIPCQIADTTFKIVPKKKQFDLPEMPSGIKPWLTCVEEGRKTLWTAKKAASTDLSIYLSGETGTGKEVLAHLIHGWSHRRSGPFIAINCAALPLSLVESELFGHVKGAFTGAVQHRPGALMQAHGGTLFLDEIGDLPFDIQVKLLRFLENGEIRPVGADRNSRVDVRLISATHQSLKELIQKGSFRKDLYYRIASVTLTLPTLKSRPEDISMLACRFAAESHQTLSPRALLRLQAHSWPGNVRELRHAVERASGLAGPFVSVLDEEAFEFLLTHENIAQSPELELGAPVLSFFEMERVLLLRSLRLTAGNRAEAAKILGIARSTLFGMLKKHGISGPRQRKPPAAIG